ncbi:hypothetical protein O3G_MSEX002584 [Manduca sexta]|uniref:CCHC-type domain-containing protein n=1 Tax=Manduca sexta TaxID=7130 RepID=A0A921YNX7_MANSE|nr:hypothetical protein O3G_MSEX002584 [Manduca sexta]
MTTNTLSIQKLTGRDNFSTWKFAMEAYLQHEELWECITSVDSVDNKKDIKAKSKIILSIDPQLYVHVQDASTAKLVWDKLSKAFEDSGLLRKVGLLRDLINTNLNSSTNVEDYINKIMSAAHKLRAIGFSVDDEWLGTLMLAGLPEEYKPMIMGIESSGIKISADLIKTKLLQEVRSDTTTAFYVKSNKYKNSQHNKNKTTYSEKPKGPRCFNCNKHGHVSKQCWFRNKKENNNDTKNSFVAAFSASLLNDNTSWYVDSGASSHMTMHGHWLQNKKAPPVDNIRIADNKVLSVHSCGTVTIQVPNEATGIPDCIQVNDVLYVPDLSTNLLSVSKIISNGNQVEFNENGCAVKNKQGHVVANAKLVNNTYKLLSCHSGKAMLAISVDKYLWHQRLGHINFNDLNKIPDCTLGVKMSQQNKEITCIPCLQAKQTRLPFKHEGYRASKLLELIHSDVCGPMENQSIGGARRSIGQKP